MFLQLCPDESLTRPFHVRRHLSQNQPIVIPHTSLIWTDIEVNAVESAQTLRLVSAACKQIDLEVTIMLVHVFTEGSVEGQGQVDLEVLQANGVDELNVAGAGEAVSRLLASDMCDVFSALLDVGEPVNHDGDAGEREVASAIEEFYCFGADSSRSKEERASIRFQKRVLERRYRRYTIRQSPSGSFDELVVGASAFQFLRGDRDCSFVAKHHLVN